MWLLSGRGKGGDGSLKIYWIDGDKKLQQYSLTLFWMIESQSF